MVGVRFLGGLGNQLFQYAFYLYLKKYGNDVYADLSDYDVHKHHYGFELTNVFSGVELDTISDKQLNRYRFDPNSFLGVILRKIFRLRLTYDNEINEMPARMLIAPFIYNENIYFNGFWANIRYVDEVKEILHQQLTFNYNMEGKNLELADKLKKVNNVSVHVRRGDFLKSEKLSSCCDLEYYRKAFKVFMDIDQDVLFVVFSDDIDWARENIIFSPNVIFVDWNTGANSSIDMLMMSLCNNNIIANSTFSWWAAWLNNNPNKIVIAPKKWSAENTNVSTILYEDWILL